MRLGSLAPLLILMFGQLLLLCFDYLGLMNNYDQWRAINFGVVAYIVCCGFLFFRTLQQSPGKYIFVYLFLTASVLTLGFFSSIVSPCFYSSFWNALSISLYIAVIFIFVALLRNKVNCFFDGLTYIVIFIFFLLAAQFLGGYVSGVFSNDLGRELFFNDIVNYRFLNQVQTLLLPLLFFSSYFKSFNRFYFVDILLVVHLIALMVLGSRGTFLGLFCAVVLGACLGIVTRKHAKKIIALTVIAFLLFYLLFYILPQLFYGPEPQISVRTSASGRIELWLYSIQMFQEGLFWGKGGMNFMFESPHGRAAHPHNFIFNVMAEWGSLGLFLLFVVLAGFVKTLWNLKNKLCFSNARLGSVTVSLFAGIIHGLFSGLFVMPVPQVLITVLMSIYLAFYFDAFFSSSSAVHLNASTNTKENQLLRYNFLIVVPLILCVTIGYAMVWRFPNVFTSEAQVIGRTGPRLWVDGGVVPPFCKASDFDNYH